MTAYAERPLYFDAGDETLFGVLTEPRAATEKVGLLAITGGGWIPGTHRNGMWVSLARRIAEHGFRTMRFDFHGVGESTGTTQRFLLHEPYTTDAIAAHEALSEFGNESVVLIGTCFGGRTAADAGATGPKPAGVALLAVPLLEPGEGTPDHRRTPIRLLAKRAAWGEVLGRLRSSEYRRLYSTFLKRRILRPFRRRRRSNGDSQSRYVRNLTELVDSGVPVLLVFGERDQQYTQYVNARQGRLASFFQHVGDRIEVRVVPGELHGFASLEAQANAIAAIEEWVLERFSNGAGE